MVGLNEAGSFWRGNLPNGAYNLATYTIETRFSIRYHASRSRQYNYAHPAQDLWYLFVVSVNSKPRLADSSKVRYAGFVFKATILQANRQFMSCISLKRFNEPLFL